MDDSGREALAERLERMHPKGKREVWVCVRAEGSEEAEEQAVLRMEGEGWYRIKVLSAEHISDDQWRCKIQGFIYVKSDTHITGRDATVPLRSS